MSLNLRHPFGEESCEAEIDTLQKSYSDYYFTHTLFSSEALKETTYLFVGRKGAGKTSLAHYFTFCKEQNSYECIDVDEPKVYHNVLRSVCASMGPASEVAVSRIATIWEYVLWMMVFTQYKDLDPVIRAVCIVDKDHKWSRLIRILLRGLLRKFAGDDRGELAGEIEDLVDQPTFLQARDAVLKLTGKRPVIIAVDSLEDYATDDEAMMHALAGLVECASKFNQRYSQRGVHIKVFITAEIFPHLCEEHITNLLKYVREPLYLHWRPKELIRLICWRLHSYLESTGELLRESWGSINWDSSKDVIHKMWTPYFGRNLRNGVGRTELTLPYILRHTQLRPRQLIVICNSIAAIARQEKSFPKFSEHAIKTAVHAQEINLAKEVLNSYKKVYPSVADIVSSLTSQPIMFEGRVLDGVAKDTASQWPDGKYNLMAFRRLVAELGIVGRVRKHDEAAGYVAADFEYVMEDRLSLQPRDQCVIHPMFFSKLNVDVSSKLRVLPFPSKVEFEDVMED